MKSAPTEIFRLAREKGDMEAWSGVKLGRRGPCPICGAGKRKDTAFSHWQKTGLGHCFRCDFTGDVIRLVEQLTGLRPIDAARHILGLPMDGSLDPAAIEETREAKRQRDKQLAARARKAEDAQARRDAYHAKVIAGFDEGYVVATASPRLRAWLGEARGLPLHLLPDVMENLRSVPSAFYAEDRATFGRIEHPAMVADIEDGETGEIVGRHVTYLSHYGTTKAEVDAPRKVWGSIGGGVWLTARDPNLGPLFVGEGIETASSMLAGWREKHGVKSGRALAVLSLANLQGGWMLDPWGRMDAERPQPDSARPAVTWRRMGRVVIGVDHDMAPIQVKVRKAHGGTAYGVLDATMRMEICARLAAHWWTIAGAELVTVARPSLGKDFNDEWRDSRAGKENAA